MTPTLPDVLRAYIAALPKCNMETERAVVSAPIECGALALWEVGGLYGHRPDDHRCDRHKDDRLGMSQIGEPIDEVAGAPQLRQIVELLKLPSFGASHP